MCMWCTSSFIVHFNRRQYVRGLNDFQQSVFEWLFINPKIQYSTKQTLLLSFKWIWRSRPFPTIFRLRTFFSRYFLSLILFTVAFFHLHHHHLHFDYHEIINWIDINGPQSENRNEMRCHSKGMRLKKKTA